MSFQFPFSLGRTLVTREALRLLGDKTSDLLYRHHQGDWGDIGEFDRRVNEEALKCGDRLVSAYEVNGQRFFVITEADRSATTVMLAEEY